MTNLKRYFALIFLQAAEIALNLLQIIKKQGNKKWPLMQKLRMNDRLGIYLHDNCYICPWVLKWLWMHLINLKIQLGDKCITDNSNIPSFFFINFDLQAGLEISSHHWPKPGTFEKPPRFSGEQYSTSITDLLGAAICADCRQNAANAIIWKRGKEQKCWYFPGIKWLAETTKLSPEKTSDEQRAKWQM